MNTKKKEFESIWWEMEELEPLTPNTSPYYESNEVSTPVRQTKEERLR